MTGAQTVQCQICEGTGTIEVASTGRPSREALLRKEMAKSWDLVGRYERFVKSMYETAGAAIAELVGRSVLDTKCRYAVLWMVCQFIP